MSAGRTSRATAWLGLVFGVGCIVLFSRNARWAEIGKALADANPLLIAVAAGCLLMTSVARAWRWRYLLHDASVSFRHRFTSTLIGFAGNNVLPGRLGEPLRCWTIGRLDRRITFWHAAGSILVERAFDLAAAIVLLAIFLNLAPFTARGAMLLSRLEEHAAFIALVMVIVIVGLAVLAGRIPSRGSWSTRFAKLLGGLRSMRAPRALAPAAFHTALLWIAMLLFELAMLRAFGFHELGAAHALGLLVVLSFAIALPQAPASVGVVQVAAETTLTALYGMPVDRAKAFAIGLWVCQVSLVVGAGAGALWMEGLSLGDVRDARGSLESLTADDPDSP